MFYPSPPDFLRWAYAEVAQSTFIARNGASIKKLSSRCSRLGKPTKQPKQLRRACVQITWRARMTAAPCPCRPTVPRHGSPHPRPAARAGAVAMSAAVVKRKPARTRIPRVLLPKILSK
eukprot:scaffold81533_cov54-Phaeocystis_antarctica.AAC.4